MSWEVEPESHRLLLSGCCGPEVEFDGVAGEVRRALREVYPSEAGRADGDLVLLWGAVPGLAGVAGQPWGLGDFLGVTQEVCKLCVCRWEQPLCVPFCSGGNSTVTSASTS